ncbi:MAG: ATP-grasp domain-containing protein [Archaeoglobaceae archaeon]
MKLFLFEFATCGDEVPEQIAVEGLAMFKTLLKGFSKHFEISSFVKSEFKDYFNLPDGKIDEIESYLEKADAFLIVAPEDDYTLLRLTEKAEKFCENLGSSSKAIAVTSDKWKLYKKLKNRVLMPKTSKKELGGSFLIKPRVSCGGEGIRFSSEVPKGYIAQEFVKGENLSVSLIVGDEIRAVSVNEQLIEDFRYKGAIVPARISKERAIEVCEIAMNAVEAIKGLNGYVGVDVVYSDQPYVIEVNARITTPCIAFEKAYATNVADMIMGESPRGTFRRQKIEKGNFEDFFTKVGNYALRLVDLEA